MTELFILDKGRRLGGKPCKLLHSFQSHVRLLSFNLSCLRIELPSPAVGFWLQRLSCYCSSRWRTPPPMRRLYSSNAVFRERKPSGLCQCQANMVS